MFKYHRESCTVSIIEKGNEKASARRERLCLAEVSRFLKCLLLCFIYSLCEKTTSQRTIENVAQWTQFLTCDLLQVAKPKDFDSVAFDIYEGTYS